MKDTNALAELMPREIIIIIGKKKYTTTIPDVVEQIEQVVEQNKDAFDED